MSIYWNFIPWFVFTCRLMDEARKRVSTPELEAVTWDEVASDIVKILLCQSSTSEAPRKAQNVQSLMPPVIETAAREKASHRSQKKPVHHKLREPDEIRKSPEIAQKDSAPRETVQIQGML